MFPDVNVPVLNNDEYKIRFFRSYYSIFKDFMAVNFETYRGYSWLSSSRNGRRMSEVLNLPLQTHCYLLPLHVWPSSFFCCGPTVWNSLPEVMRDPECSVDGYRQSLKTFLFSQYWCVQRIRGLLR